MKTSITLSFLVIMLQSVFSQDTNRTKYENDSTLNKSVDTSHSIYDKEKILESLRKVYGSKKKDSSSVMLHDTGSTKIYLLKNKHYGRWKIGDMAVESGCGIGFSLLGALVGGAVGSLFHSPGDKSSDEGTKTVVYFSMAFGHAIGSALGVNFGGKQRSVKGSKILSFIGSVVGEVPSLLLFINNRNIYTGAFLAIIPSVIATIGYNLLTE